MIKAYNYIKDLSSSAKHLLPPRPAGQQRAALACKLWARLFAGRGFCCRYCERHRLPPCMLGLLANVQHCPRRFVPTRAASAGERGAPRLGLHRLRPRRLGPHHRRAAAPARCSPWSEAVNAQWSDAHEIHTVYAWLLYAAASREQASETRKGKCSGLNAKSAIDIEALAVAVVFTKHRGGAALVCAVARARVAARQCASRQWPVAMAFRRNSHGLCALMRAPSAGVRLHPRRTQRCCGGRSRRQ